MLAFLVIGVIGVILYMSMFLLTISCWHYAINRYTRRIFLLLSLFCILELPLYFHLMIFSNFGGKEIYAVNMMSSICYFGTFSVVCFAWGDVLRAKNLEVLFEARRRQHMRFALVVMNIGFMVVVALVIAKCLASRNLQSFLESDAYLMFVAIDTFKNIILGIFIALFGNNLRSRLQNYCGDGAARGGIVGIAISQNSDHLMRVSYKLLVLVTVSIFSFSVKVVAIFVYRATSAENDYEPPKNISDFQVLWWIIFEFIPVAVPAFTISFTMGWPSKLIGGQGLSFPDSNISSATATNRMHQRSVSDDQRNPASIDSITPRSSMCDEDVPTTGASAAALRILQQRHSLVNDDDCFHIMDRLSSISADLVDIELGRNSEYAAELRKSLQLTSMHSTGAAGGGGEEEGGAGSRSTSVSSSISNFFSKMHGSDATEK
jgi:hypothetical protein